MSGNMKSMVPKSEQLVKREHHVRSQRDVEIGRRIRELREDLGVSTRQFAHGIKGLRTSNLSEIERGMRRVSSGVLQGIQRKYGASIDWLLSGKDPGRDPTIGRIKARAVPVLEVDVAMSYLFGPDGPPSFMVPPGEEFAPAVTDDPRAFQVRAEGSLEIRGIDTIFVEPGREIEPGDVVILENMPSPPQICFYQRTPDGGAIFTSYSNPSRTPIILSAPDVKRARMYRVSGLFKRL